jgi:hypothetical protein
MSFRSEESIDMYSLLNIIIYVELRLFINTIENPLFLLILNSRYCIFIIYTNVVDLTMG